MYFCGGRIAISLFYMNRLGAEFYNRTDVVQIAKDLLGKVLVCCENGFVTSGIICETEAYAGITDRASHAFGDRRTARTEIMYKAGGHSYVYLCYGIHRLFNVVTNVENVPHAVLVRGVIPLDGVEIIGERRQGNLSPKTGIGPGNVTRCLGIEMHHNAHNMLLSDEIWIEERGILMPDAQIVSCPRIGVDYAGEDAKLPYRFFISTKGNTETT
jgi:DNA-3-methyladenine glycosylase